MQLRPEWPWIFRSMCAYLHPYHIYLHVSYILSLSLPDIFLYVSYVLSLSLPHISSSSWPPQWLSRNQKCSKCTRELFQIPFQQFNSEIGWVRVAKPFFLCNPQLSRLKWMKIRLWLMLRFHFSLRPLPSPSEPDFSSFLFVYLSRPGLPILSNVCSPNCKPWSCSFLQHYQKYIVSYILWYIFQCVLSKL